MKKSLHPVSDHAVVRYLERVEGMDIDALRAVIGRKAEKALELGAEGAISDGFVYKLKGGVVTTVAPLNRPDKRFARRPRTGAIRDE